MYEMNQYSSVHGYSDERFGPITPLAAGLIGAGLGFIGGQFTPGSNFYGPPLPPPNYYGPYGPVFMPYEYPVPYGPPGPIYGPPGVW